MIQGLSFALKLLKIKHNFNCIDFLFCCFNSILSLSIQKYCVYDSLYPTDLDYSNSYYTSFVCIVALMQGDFEYFLKYCKDFFKIPDDKEESGSTYLKEAARLLMLCYSYTQYTELNEISGVKDEYLRMLKELFPNNYQAISHLHKLSSLNRDKLASIFINKNTGLKNSKDDYDKKLYEGCVKELFTNNLKLDDNSVEWIEALIKVCMREVSALDYICKVYNISSTQVKIYKAILSNDQALYRKYKLK